MAKNTELFFTKAANNQGTDFENADGTTKADIFTAGTEGSIIRSIAITSDDSAAMAVLFYFQDGTNEFCIGRVEVPAGAGTDGTTKAINVLNTDDFPWTKYDNAKNRIIMLANGEKLQAAMVAEVTAEKKVVVAAFGEDF